MQQGNTAYKRKRVREEKGWKIFQTRDFEQAQKRYTLIASHTNLSTPAAAYSKA